MAAARGWAAAAGAAAVAALWALAGPTPSEAPAPASVRSDEAEPEAAHQDAPAGERVAIATVADRLCTLRGRLPVGAAPLGLLPRVTVDSSQAFLDEDGAWKTAGLEPGTHRVLAIWREPSGAFAIAQRTVALQPAEDHDLGMLAVADVPWAWLRIVPQQLWPDGTRTPMPDTAFAHEPTRWASTDFASIAIDTIPIGQLPIGRPILVRGLTDPGLRVRLLDVTGLGPAARRWNWDRRLAEADLVPQSTTELPIVFVRRVGIELEASWPRGDHGWIEVHVVPDSGSKHFWARREGRGHATATLEVDEGPATVIVSNLDRHGVTRAFALRTCRLRDGERLRFALSPTVPAAGTWPRAGARIDVALQAWPAHPLWRADASAEGRFAIAGLPPDAPLVATDDAGTMMPLRIVQRPDGHVLAPASR